MSDLGPIANPLRQPTPAPRRPSRLTDAQARGARRTGALAFGTISMGVNAVLTVLGVGLTLLLAQWLLIELFEGLEYQGWGVLVQAWLRSLDFTPLVPWGLGILVFGAALVAVGAWLSVRGLRRAAIASPGGATWLATALGLVAQLILLSVGAALAGVGLPLILPTLSGITLVIVAWLVVSTIWAGLVGALVGPLAWWAAAHVTTPRPSAPVPNPAAARSKAPAAGIDDAAAADDSSG